MKLKSANMWEVLIKFNRLWRIYNVCTLNPFKAAKMWRASVCQFANHALVKINHVVASFGIKATLPKDAM